MKSRSTAVPFEEPTHGQPDSSTSPTPEDSTSMQQGSGRSPRVLATEDPNYRPAPGFWPG